MFIVFQFWHSFGASDPDRGAWPMAVDWTQVPSADRSETKHQLYAVSQGRWDENGPLDETATPYRRYT